MARAKLWGWATLLLMLGGCTGVNIDDYANGTPALTPQYFVGPVKAWGIVHKRSGKVVQRFVVNMNGETIKGDLFLHEHFIFDDGHTRDRTWKLSPVPGEAGHYSGSAGGVVGFADVTARGNAMHWLYLMDLPVKDNTYRLSFDDWMFALDDKTVVGLVSMRKFGFVVGEVNVFMQKQ